jgi:hypothetical protein
MTDSVPEVRALQALLDTGNREPSRHLAAIVGHAQVLLVLRADPLALEPVQQQCRYVSSVQLCVSSSKVPVQA